MVHTIVVTVTLYYALLCLTAQLINRQTDCPSIHPRGFEALSWKQMEGMAWNLANANVSSPNSELKLRYTLDFLIFKAIFIQTSGEIGQV